jgi:hypothetical protein
LRRDVAAGQLCIRAVIEEYKANRLAADIGAAFYTRFGQGFSTFYRAIRAGFGLQRRAVCGTFFPVDLI